MPHQSPMRLVRDTLVVVGLGCATAFLGTCYDGVLPVASWPIWKVSLIAFYLCTLAIAALGAGMRVVSLLLKTPVSSGPNLVVSFGVGVYVFFGLTFLTGALGLLRAAYFYWGPLLLIVFGWRPLTSIARAAKGALTSARLTQPRINIWEALGVVATLCLASCTLLPSLAGYDATWYHLPLAEQYAHTGTIHPYPEGWILAAYPHLASVIYAWAFLAPGLELHEHTILACQIEFVCEFVGWLSIPLLVGVLMGGRGPRWSWACIFLFPAVFFFRPSGGAEYFPALWAVCLYFATLEVWPKFELRRAILLGLLVGAVLCTKYSCYVLLPGLGLALLGRGAVLLWRARRTNPSSPSRTQLAWSLSGFAVTVLLTSTPHWLKNLAFYGDPLFPLGRRWFPTHPWVRLAEHMQENFWNAGELIHPPLSWEGVAESLVALVDFSFRPRAGLETLYFGSLFTLTLPLLPWLGLSRRVWGLTAWILSSIFCWYWLHAQDRYLVALLPWMSAVTVTCLVKSARSSGLARPFVLVLVLLQALHSIRQFALVLPHPMLSEVYSGTRPGSADLSFRGSLRAIGEKLPEDAVVLVHDEHQLFGLNRKTVADAVAWRGGFDYLEMQSDQEVYRKLLGLEVTHLLWRRSDSYGWDSEGGYLTFYGFAARQGHHRFASGEYQVAEMPAREPSKATRPVEVLVALCPGSYATGVYKIEALNVPGLDRTKHIYPPPLRPLNVTQETQVRAEIERVDALLVNRTCLGQVQAHLHDPFTLAFRRDQVEGWVRMAPNR